MEVRLIFVADFRHRMKLLNQFDKEFIELRKPGHTPSHLMYWVVCSHKLILVVFLGLDRFLAKLKVLAGDL